MKSPTRTAATWLLVATLCVGLLLNSGCSAGGDDGSERPSSGTDSANSGETDELDAEPGEEADPGSATDSGAEDATGGDVSGQGDEPSEGNDLEFAESGPPLGGYEPGPDVVAGERILILEENGRISSVDPDGGAETELRSAREGPIPRQPTWSSDGRFVAWVEVGATGGSTVVVSTSDGASQRGFSVGTIPFFLSWSPANDGRLAMLASTNGIELAHDVIDVLREPIDDQTASRVAAGGPLFTAWEPTGGRLAAHVSGSELSIVGADGSSSERDPIPTTGFNTPIWLSSGEVVFVRPASGEGDLGGEIVAASIRPSDLAEPADPEDPDSPEDPVDREGTAAEPLVEAVRALASAPDGAWMVAEAGERSLLVQPPLRVAAGRDPEVQQVGLDLIEADATEETEGLQEPEQPEELAFNLQRLDLDSGELTTVLAETALAFTASPAARNTLALLAPEAPNRISPEWVVVDEAGDIVARMPLIPNEDFVRNYLPFFDQYAQTTSYWSTDGERFLAVGAEPDGVSGVWIGGINGEVRRLQDGLTASWRPGPVPEPVAGGGGVV